jgi:flagellar protein FlaI
MASEEASQSTPPTAADPPEESLDTDRIEQEVLDDVRRYFATADEAATDVLPGESARPSDEFVTGRWFDFVPLREGTVVSWDWVREPYSLVAVQYLDDQRVYRYHVVEPVFDEFEEYVRDDLGSTLRSSLMYESDDDDRDQREVFADQMREVVSDHAATVTPGTVQKIYYSFLRDYLGYGMIDPLMRDPAIEDISCDGENVPLFIYHRDYRDLRTNISFSREELNSLAVRLAHRAGKHLSVSNPLVDASLEDGSRIQLTLGGEISKRGTNFTVRKFSDVPMTPVDLIRTGTFSVEQMAYFWLAIENNMSLLFAGGTGSGKTTSLNAVSFFIPPDSKVVSIEDTGEITLPHDNWVQSLTRDSSTASGRGEVSTYALLQAALRQRPEYLLVGEIRTEQRVALTFFQAIGTGHTAYSTVHADTVDAALARLRNPPLSVPGQLIQNLDILSIQRQTYLGADRVRRNDAVAELVTGDGDDVDPHLVFERDAERDAHEQLAESEVMQRVARRRGWAPDRIDRELSRRERVLRRLVDQEADYERTARTIHAFARDPDGVLARLDGDNDDTPFEFADVPR